jgi:hypothetical protein
MTMAFCTVIFGLATLWFAGIVFACWILALGRSAAEAVLVMGIILLMRSENCKSYGESYRPTSEGQTQVRLPCAGLALGITA